LGREGAQQAEKSSEIAFFTIFTDMRPELKTLAMLA
jgi:hypothetical protein